MDDKPSEIDDNLKTENFCHFVKRAPTLILGHPIYRQTNRTKANMWCRLQSIGFISDDLYLHITFKGLPVAPSCLISDTRPQWWSHFGAPTGAPGFNEPRAEALCSSSEQFAKRAQGGLIPSAPLPPEKRRQEVCSKKADSGTNDYIVDMICISDH